MKDITDSLYFDFVDPQLPNSNAINKRISRDLREVVECLRRHLHFVQGIFLTGGYSRSEGTVLSARNGIELMSDYDILVDTRFLKLLNQYKCKRLEPRLTRALGIPVEISVLVAKIPKRILFYELFEEGLCIYGKRDLTRCRFSPEEIAKYDGVRLLFNRMQGLAVAVDERFPSEPSSEESRRNITKECSKGFLSIAESLLLLDDSYVPTYRERNALFQNVFRTEFSDLRERMPDLPHYMDLATKWKLDPRTSYDAGPVELWFKVRDYMINTLRYFIDRIAGPDTDRDTLSLVEGFMISRGYLERWSNLKYLVLKFLNEDQIYPKVLFLSPPVSTRLKTSLLYTLDSISPDGRVDMHKLGRAHSILDRLDRNASDLSEPSDLGSWKRMIDFLQKNYSMG